MVQNNLQKPRPRRPICVTDHESRRGELVLRSNHELRARMGAGRPRHLVSNRCLDMITPYFSTGIYVQSPYARVYHRHASPSPAGRLSLVVKNWCRQTRGAIPVMIADTSFFGTAARIRWVTALLARCPTYARRIAGWLRSNSPYVYPGGPRTPGVSSAERVAGR